MVPSACGSSATCALSLAAKTDGVARGIGFFRGPRNAGLSAMGEERREFALRYRAIAQSQLYRNIIEPTRPEAAIEVPQARHDDADDGDLDVGPGLVEHQEIHPRAQRDLDAGVDLRARGIERPEIQSRRQQWIFDRRQERIVLDEQRRFAVEARLLAGAAFHEADRQELVQLGQGAQQRDALVEMRAGAELD